MALLSYYTVLIHALKKTYMIAFTFKAELN